MIYSMSYMEFDIIHVPQRINYEELYEEHVN